MPNTKGIAHGTTNPPIADLEAGEEPRDIYSFGRQNWFEAVGREHLAAR